LFLLQPTVIVYIYNTGYFDNAVGEQEMESKMRESTARCGRLGRSEVCTYTSQISLEFIYKCQMSQSCRYVTSGCHKTKFLEIGRSRYGVNVEVHTGLWHPAFQHDRYTWPVAALKFFGCRATSMAPEFRLGHLKNALLPYF